MKSKRFRQGGFSLVELMIATAVFSIVAVQMGVGFTGLFRLMRHSYAEAEIAVAEHKMHDRILFSLKPADEEGIPSGALSFTNVTVSSSGIAFAGDIMNISGNSIAGVPKVYELVLGSDRIFSIQSDVNSCKWLTPANMFSLESDMSQVARLVNNGKVLEIDVAMRMRNEDVRRTQRISIPIFRRIQ
ncbi:MAG: prepilin-type N-terminal cleavage/methylation domain-containing protein [Kiritimatiellae bacterium]|nr:prepilin-type N-terminal cleavage/methylation domain-containing protein [Kiritimatiellia bacterium]